MLLGIYRQIQNYDTFYGFPIGQILEDSWIGPACISKQTEQAGNNWAKHFIKSQSKYEFE